MLSQLTAEVSELFKDKPVIEGTLNILRRMKPTRQVEAATFMLATENYSKSFAKALLVATKPAELATLRSRPVRGLSPEMKGDMQREMELLLNDLRATENYGTDVLSLVVAAGYVAKLIGNQEIERYLRRNHPETLQEFRKIIATASLDHSSAERD